MVWIEEAESVLFVDKLVKLELACGLFYPKIEWVLFELIVLFAGYKISRFLRNQIDPKDKQTNKEVQFVEKTWFYQIINKDWNLFEDLSTHDVKYIF